MSIAIILPVFLIEQFLKKQRNQFASRTKYSVEGSKDDFYIRYLPGVEKSKLM